MKQRDLLRSAELGAAIVNHARDRRPLPGVADSQARATFVRQLVDSIHRVTYPTAIAARTASARRADPNDDVYFDPIRAAIYYMQHGDIDEACWLVFLFVHFGKHARGGYRYARDVYGRLASGDKWDWRTVSGDVEGFIVWLADHHEEVRTRAPGGFGNHRKYESLTPEHTGRTVATYVSWVSASGDHQSLFDDSLKAASGNAGLAFDQLYRSMSQVSRFGRTARFDYLTMIGKLGIARIAPDSVYLAGATGPREGARLLYGVGSNVGGTTLEMWLREFDADIQVGAQALEDALCNWQKSPERYVRFRG